MKQHTATEQREREGTHNHEKLSLRNVCVQCAHSQFLENVFRVSCVFKSCMMMMMLLLLVVVAVAVAVLVLFSLVIVDIVCCFNSGVILGKFTRISLIKLNLIEDLW